MELKEAKNLAVTLMKFYGLVDWKFKFDFARRRFGCCDYSEKTISLSKHLVPLNSFDRVKDVILHEIAHALTPGHHHDKVWKQKAIEIGCDGNRCYSLENTKVVSGKYTAFCKGCNQTHNRFRIPKYNTSCGKCSKGVYNSDFKLVYKLKSKQS